ncbi:MAG: aspartate--ammonia ligase [Tissierellia bacterium]|nr:aspartate--ammonia ligase [Tissierellia bacterium]
MEYLITPKNYKSSPDVIETQIQIKMLKDYFQEHLANTLHLNRVTAPLFVPKKTGINDNLTGVEKPVSFFYDNCGSSEELEIVQSLAKWKRIALKKYNIPVGQGIYTDMNAIRPSEICDNTHSLYVDQWDWEKTISRDERNLDYLKETVNEIYSVFLNTDKMLARKIEGYKTFLAPKITFVTSQELEDYYPTLSPEEREKEFCKKHGTIFIIGIGHKLNSGEKHSHRAPDYDDWLLNGDLVIWHDVIDTALELSSMGIRVNKEVLLNQIELSNSSDRLNLDYHKMLLNNELPLTIGGGIGQSRLCMLFLRKAHIGEVQASVWPTKMLEECNKNGIYLL